MKKLIPLTVLALLLSTSVAAADRRGRDHRRNDDHRRRGDVVVRDHRDQRHDQRAPRYERRRESRPRYAQRVYVNGGAFRFHGGVVKRWRRPVITHRYYDHAVRPAPIVEYFDPMPGYVWMAGQWQWTGYEWTWVPGHYMVARDYNDAYGHDAYGYDAYGYDAAAAPVYPASPPPYGPSPYTSY